MISVEQDYRPTSFLHTAIEVEGSRFEAAAPASAPSRAAPTGFYQAHGKRIFDVILASIMIILCAPLMALTAFVVWWNDGSPVIFVQDRAGLNLKSFAIFKFRTMYKGLGDACMSWKRSDPNWNDGITPETADRDPRIIRGSGWLRRYSLDELPQLLNVLRGEMSIVGPRPLLCRQVTENPNLRAEIVRRSIVKPGITGLWQVSGRSDITFERMMVLDGQYVDGLSFGQDIVILFKTIVTVIRAAGAA